jgi:uncharacterized membrane protein
MSRRLRRLLGSACITGWYGLALWHLWIPRALMHHLTFLRYQSWAFGHFAYSDLVALYLHHHLANHALMYWHTPIEYPVLMGALMWLIAWVPTLSGFFAVSTALLWASAVTTYLMLDHWTPRTATAFAVSPLWLSFGALNWDGIGIALMCAALALYRRQSWRWSGVVWALAVFFKLFPLVFVPLLVAQLMRDQMQAAFRRFAVAFVTTSLVINVPPALANWTNWALFFGFNAGRSAQADLWSNFFWHGPPVALVDGLSLTVVLAVISWAVYQVSHGAPVPTQAAQVFGIFLLVNKVFSPQYMLWFMAYLAVAEVPWPTLAIISGAGLIDYLNSLWILHLGDVASPKAVLDYGRTLFTAGLATRYLSLVSGLSSTWRRQPLPVGSPIPDDTVGPGS